MMNNKMKAVICQGYGAPEVLKIKSVHKPKPKENELLIKIYATAVNSGDTLVRSLKVDFLAKLVMRIVFGWRKPRKAILGTVYSGIVVQVGQKVRDYKMGDEVFGLRGFQFGTYAEYIAVKERSILCKKPSNASFEEAAAILFGGQTAHYFLNKSKLPKVRGLNLLVYGASSAVGTAALQIANHYGAKLTAVCSDKNESLVAKLGAEEVIFYNQVDFKKTEDRYDVIFDAVGKITKKDCSHLLNPKGLFLSTGGLDYAKESREQVSFLKELFEQGIYKACIDKIYSLDEIVEAHRYVDTGRKKGNVVLKIAP